MAVNADKIGVCSHFDFSCNKFVMYLIGDLVVQINKYHEINEVI